MGLELASNYASFHHEARRLHAIRIVHLVEAGTSSLGDSKSKRTKYAEKLGGQLWSEIRPYSLLMASVSEVHYLNPPDLTRWGGLYLPSPIGHFFRSNLIPAAIILTTCSDDEIDNRLREKIASSSDHMRVEALSWFGYSPIPKESDKHLTAPFRILTENYDSLEDMSQMALVFFQHRKTRELDKIEEVFSGLGELSIPQSFSRREISTVWTPFICGLLKGNIDGFVILCRSEKMEGTERDYADELSAYLTSPDGPIKGFWSKISVISIFLGHRLGEVVEQNIRLLKHLSPSTTGEGDK